MKVVHHGFEGRFSANPRALHEAMTVRRGAADEHVWLADPAHRHGFPPEVTTVSFGSEEALADLDAVQEAHRDRCAAFQERFCHLEDGRASDRVLDAVLPLVRGGESR